MDKLTSEDYQHFTHCHTHSMYSLLDGLGKIPELVSRAKQLGMTSLALTDHGVMYGVIEFYKECKAQGIKPIVGVEAYLAPRSRFDKSSRSDGSPNHQILLVQNEEGYKNLCTLTTIAHIEGYYYKPRIDREVLKKHNKGLIATTACLAGAVPRAIVTGSAKRDLSQAKREVEEFLEIFGPERFFLELQHNPTIDIQKTVNDGMLELADEFKIRPIITGDTHYVNKEDADTHDILICIQTGRTVEEEDRMSYLPEYYHMQDPRELHDLFPENPELIRNTKDIADNCNLEIELGVNKLPHFPVPKGFNEYTYLVELCDKGLEDRFGTSDKAKLDKAILERLDFELSTIKKMGFAGYFLIVQDYIVWAKEQGIVVGPGRGSAAGSLVTFLLRITDIDPLKYDLLFERFLNPDRISMPDIDTDFADDRRDEVIEYVAVKYGRDHVAQIITFGTMAARAAVRDCGRALGLAYSFCDKIAKLIPMFTTLTEAIEGVSELRELYEDDEQVRRLLDNAKKLEGVCRHASTHACAVVIAPEPLPNMVPCQYASGAGDDKSIVTQYEMNAIEDMGLLKMDFLGLKNLTIIDKARQLIEELNGVKIDIDNIPLDDKKAYELFQIGHTTGVFQFESQGMKRWLKQLQPTEFEDVIAMVALYRPGPMEFIPDYIEGKHGTKKVTYLHPLLEEVVGNTYGVAIYQEQIMKISRVIALFTPGEADTLRKGMGKKIKEVVDKMHDQFIVGAGKNNIDKKTAQAIWEYIEPFASYGFNRSHAACYALIGYQTAYLKAHYPAEFMAALLTADQGNTDRVAIEVDECRQMGIEVLPPDINESVKDFTVVQHEGKQAIRFGLGAVKNVGEGIIEAVIIERKEGGKFEDLNNFLNRVFSKDLNKKSMESLGKCGAFDSMEKRNDILENMEMILAYSKELHKIKESGQKDLFGGLSSQEITTLRLKPQSAASKKVRLGWEKELLGLYISDHPLREYSAYLEIYTIGVTDITEEIVDYTVVVGGIISAVRKIITKKGDPMAFVTIEDMKNKIEVLVFPKTYERKPDMWEEGKIVKIKGTVNDKDGSLKILADSGDIITEKELQKKLPDHPEEARVTPPDPNKKHPYQRKKEGGRSMARPQAPTMPSFEPNPETPRALFLKIQDGTDKSVLQDIANELAQIEDGYTPVYIVLENKGELKKVKTKHRITITQNLIDNIANHIGRDNVKTI